MKEVRRVLVGFEFGEKESQICYYDRKLREPVSVPARVGTNQLAFPTSLTGIPDSGEWHCGTEAEYFAAHEGGTAVRTAEDSFYETVRKGKDFQIGEKRFGADELLEFFLRESLKMLGLADPVKSIAGIGVTVRALTGDFAVRIQQALGRIGFRRDICFVMDEDESFYYYGYSQRPEISSRNMALICFDGDCAVCKSMSENRTKKPFIVTVTEKGSTVLPDNFEERDASFAEAAEEWMKSGGFSGVFITGSGFSPEWASKSVKVLSGHGARVFEGSNLHVKGACWAVFERLERHAFKNRMFIGPDHVRAAVGIDIIEGNGQKFYPLIRPGLNWYEAFADCELIPDGRNDLFVTIIPSGGQAHRSERIVLTGLPARPDRATRLRVRASCTSPDTCRLDAEDLGFGELFPATHQHWTMDVSL